MAHLAKQPGPTGMTEQAPKMFSRPTESPEPMPPVRSSVELSTLHTKWAEQHAASASTTWSRGRRKMRTAASRLLGRGHDELIGDMIRAFDTLALRCDELSERLARQEALTADIAGALGQDVARLQAAVQQLRSADPGQ